jgi:zinc transport system permease protein
MLDALQYPFFQRALAAGLLASLACGVIGALVVVRRIATISGGLSHSAFGGIGLGYLLGFDPMIGATGFGVLSAIGIGVAYRRLRHGFDTLIAIVWSVGMAIGILLIAMTPGYAPDLTTYLFGSIVLVPSTYLWIAGSLDLVILVSVIVLFKGLRAVVFDEEFASVSGLPVEALFLLLLSLTGLAVVTLIRVVGVILVIALLTIPASIARQWSHSLGRMMVYGTVIGAGCTVSGLFLSYWLADGVGVNAPAGPLIILIATAGYALSILARRFVRRTVVS